ncbi:Uncharacterized protein, contains caspase domain [Mesorhizobium albiziae]|uniref:Uncharacterized protein, contains caspase domain n=1 Tax=Neomesorhizobium albiziae TaxID=335020 RepID=A0A1I4BY10_9HYPH|nr:caspase family protein [Mesorhizobium albiziae]GLS29597.1 hypothetical protein GCM10007937_13050 [Mesorhizobium albiziae]SFK73708.1 Uncharacterized protein, contains caspase domain [Mesorhizobium albiziae]
MSEKYAFLFGNSTYQDARLNGLNAPIKDVQALSKALSDPEVAGFNDVEWAINGSAGIVQVNLAKFLKQRSRDDVVLVYFTGHGLLDAENQLYLALSETNPEYPDVSSISAEWLRGKLNFCASERQILILDCCHSGAYIDGAKGADEKVAISTDTFDRQGYGRYVLAASSKTQSAFETAGSSTYTEALIKGLRDGAAAPGKPEITVADLQDYLVRKLATAVAPMRPEGSAIKKIGDLVIAKNRKFTPPIDQQLKDKLFDSDEDRRISAVDQLEDQAGSEPHRQQILELLRTRISEQNPQRENSVRVDKAIRKTIQRIEQAQTALDYVPRAKQGADVDPKQIGKSWFASFPLYGKYAAGIAGALAAIAGTLVVTMRLMDTNFTGTPTRAPVAGATTEFERSLTSEQVKAIQQFLCVASDDGIFSAETRANLREFAALNRDQPVSSDLSAERGYRLLDRAITAGPCNRSLHQNIYERLTISGPEELEYVQRLLGRIVPPPDDIQAAARDGSWRRQVREAYFSLKIDPVLPADQLTYELMEAVRASPPAFSSDQTPDDLSTSNPLEGLSSSLALQSVRPGDPPWLKKALEELHNSTSANAAEIQKYVYTVKLSIGSEDDWAVAFVAWCLENSGDSRASEFVWRTAPDMKPESFSMLGRGYSKSEPWPRGAVVVFQSSLKTISVGFYLGTENDLVYVLSGDLQNRVGIGSYPPVRILAVRSL